MIGAGNNKQVRLWQALPKPRILISDPIQKFKTLAEKVLEDPELATNPKYATNDARVANRSELVQIISDAFMKHDRDHWLKRFKGLG